MTRIHRTALAALALVLAVVLMSGGPLYAVGEGRVIGTVTDGQNKPVQGAKVLITLPGVASFKQEKTTDKAGKFTLLILDATKEYKVRIEKEGFQPYEEALKPTIQETLRITYTLAPVQAAAAAGAAPDSAEAKALEGRNAAVLAFNEGVGKLKAGDKAGAAAQFEEALKLNPDLIEAHSVLADLYVEQKKYPQAIAAAERVLQAKPKDPAALTALYDSAVAVGDKAKAESALNAMLEGAPGRDTAVRLLNKGVVDFNENRMPEAQAAFEKAEKADPTLPKTHYMLGLTYIRLDKKAEAQEHLAKFLDLAPDDKDAETAKAMLEELKK
ncbi:MAG TPA: tetratricopeptide repeat protein [Thermoanaerobaculia bacterium]|nr:tetratricopeptide repeat protein [Thermoanaerobaculia bacterium]